MSEETTSVRITQTMIYQKQLEMNELQIRMVEKLDNLDDVPERLREVEIELARLAWIERIAYSALTAAIVALIGAIFTVLGN
jgi:uncharacterized membrane protein YjjP (DUF1212 family)